MAGAPWILHISDPHLGDPSEEEPLDDEKEILASQRDLETTQKVFKRTLKALGRFVKDHGKPEVVALTGDLTTRAHLSGFNDFVALMHERTDVLPDVSRVVVVPGNHDVDWQQDAGVPARYEGFLAATRAQGCVTPLLDGVDFDPETGALHDEADNHSHVADTEHVFAVALNSSNYCGTTSVPRGGMSEDQWRDALEPLGAAKDSLLSEVHRLHQHDMARISRAQIEALGAYFDAKSLPRDSGVDSRLRVAVLHHQLLPVSVREERKAFESLVNLGQVRALLHEYGFELVLHGHKHESAIYWDIATQPDLTAATRRILVISSPGHFDVGHETMRAIVLEGVATARNARIITFLGAGPTRQKAEHDDGILAPLWLGDEAPPRERTLISAVDTHHAYARLQALFETREGEELHNLVCRVENPSDAGTPPPDLPLVSIDDPQAWLSGLVRWWQHERSELVSRGLLPFNHGERIYRRWGDQVERAIEMLNSRADSSRALISLIGPSETGRYPSDVRSLERGSFPAFALAEFTVRERDGRRYLDCFGYFRKQEMQYWWPVNVAELAELQEKVRSRLRLVVQSGQLVTFSAIALWSSTVPRVAVPMIDLLVEEPGRLLDMAAAVAFPGTQRAQAVNDWRNVLSDLAGKGRDTPPKVSAGVAILRDNLARLAPDASASGVAGILTALEELDDLYASHAAADELPSTAVKAVRRWVGKLKDAVVVALPTVAS